MDANDRTKERLAKGIKTLMVNKPLDKITVKEIVDQSELTRQTFYRYFQDKYDLVNWYFDKLAQQSIKQMGISLTLEEGLTKKFAFVRAEKDFFAAAFKSSDCNSIYDYDLNLIKDYYTNRIVKKTGKPLEADDQFLLEMYCQGSMDMTFKWVTEGMVMEPAEFAKLLIDAIPEKLRQYLLFL
ncbi:TetR/AcrR family transcriptional regulator C-terminal domain-containing protein [uncultured Acetobacterium sp.]|uniref:TetR/AcrR family transcriptional regulator C-terminal domain-containing protein n=1 Tax=uncultured Acetobacterium sp. TaxID=217139 RepID=UPI0025F1FB16|nr:TetR/AcrR family transcriptional regulator C-terminal domain-containing protein [uncultured Acetobacterium sp.]